MSDFTLDAPLARKTQDKMVHLMQDLCFTSAEIFAIFGRNLGLMRRFEEAGLLDDDVIRLMAEKQLLQS